MAVVMSHGVGGDRMHAPARPLKFCSSRGACILVVEYPLLPSNSELHIAALETAEQLRENAEKNAFFQQHARSSSEYYHIIVETCLCTTLAAVAPPDKTIFIFLLRLPKMAPLVGKGRGKGGIPSKHSPTQDNFLFPPIVEKEKFSGLPPH